MTAPKRGKLLLSDEERKRLSDRELDTATRKRNNLIVKRKIQNWLNQAEDLLFALENLTETQLENTVSDSQVFSLFKVTEKILDKLNFAPVEGTVDKPFVSWFVLPEAGGEVKVAVRRAKESDYERNWKVQEHVKALRCSYHSDPEKESSAYKNYREDREYQEIVKTCKRVGMRVPVREDIIHKKITIRGTGPLFYHPGEKSTPKDKQETSEGENDEPK